MRDTGKLQITLPVHHIVCCLHSHVLTLPPLPAVNLGALMLKALLEHWPSTHLSSDEEKKTSENSECTEYSRSIFCPICSRVPPSNC